MNEKIKIKLSLKFKGQKKELKFIDRDSSENEEDTLSIKGKGAEFRMNDENDLIVRKNKEPIANLRKGGILEEILLLIARLEFDRRRTELLLKREQETCKMLKLKLEKLSRKRAIDYPLRVQREHEACITDITELNWHISFNTKAERKLMHKIEAEEILYKQLKDDLERLGSMIPLIQDKCDAETKILNEIYRAQRDVDDLLNRARDKLKDAHERYESSLEVANKEREAIKADLDETRRELNKAM